MRSKDLVRLVAERQLDRDRRVGDFAEVVAGSDRLLQSIDPAALQCRPDRGGSAWLTSARADRPGQAPTQKEARRGRGGARPARVHVPGDRRIARSAGPSVAHTVDRPKLRHGASLPIRVGQNRIRSSPRHDAPPRRGSPPQYGGAVFSLENKVVRIEPLMERVLAAAVRNHLVLIAMEHNDRHHAGVRRHRAQGGARQGRRSARRLAFRQAPQVDSRVRVAGVDADRRVNVGVARAKDELSNPPAEIPMT